MFRVPSRPASRLTTIDGSYPWLSNTEFTPSPNDFEREFDSKVESEQRQEMDSMCKNGINVVWWIT